MKSDIDIKDDIYNHIKGSELEKEISGVLRKTVRPINSSKEDIVISVLANINGQIQESFVNVNIYVPDIRRGNQSEENTIRCRKLCQMASELLEVGHGAHYRFVLEEQRVMQVNGKDEHFINNKLLYKQSNEK